MAEPKDPPEELDVPENQEQADAESVKNLLDWLDEQEGDEMNKTKCYHGRIISYTSKNEPVCGDCGEILKRKTKINVPYRKPDETCRNPKCERPATRDTMRAGDLCEACYGAYMLGSQIGAKWAAGYASDGDPAAIRYPFWEG